MKYVGIDLGNTYSAISVLDSFDGAQPWPLDVMGRRSTASVVWFPDGKPAVVGDIAKKHLGPDADSTVAFAKHWMFLDEDGGFGKKWNINGTEYTPVDISGIILKHLYEAFLDTTSEDHKVTITCPAYFNTAQRDLIMQAAEKAGINTDPSKFTVISEPIAAAIPYVMTSPEKRGNVIVFDLGGSSLSVTALYFDKNSLRPTEPYFTVIDSQGLPYLGGVDWDKVVQEEIVRQLEENGVTAITDKMRHRLALASEQAKIDLADSDLELYTITIGNEDLEFDYTQKQFELDTEHLLKNALDQLETIINDFDSRRAHIGKDIPEEILGIVLVGGSSNMPQVSKGIEDRFPQFAGKIDVSDPSLAIANGAAYHCKMMDMVVIVDPYEPWGYRYNYGTNVLDENGQEMCLNLIEWKTPIPCKMEFHFQLAGRTDRVCNTLYRNDDCSAEWPMGRHLVSLDRCQEIGIFDIVLPEYGERGDLVEVCIGIDIGGRLTCTAKCNGTQCSISMNLIGSERRIRTRNDVKCIELDPKATDAPMETKTPEAGTEQASIKYVGIDIGTTYSRIAFLDDFDGARPRVLDVKGYISTPSVVWFPDGKPAVVGGIAKRHLGPDADSTVAFAKHWMFLDEDGGFGKKWNINGTEYTPVDISGIILKHLYEAFLDTTSEDHKVTITCPAYFNVAQRDLIRQAAEKAGINTDRENFRIVSETVAAAIECIMESSEKCGNIAVFDLGGSSLSVAVLYFEKEPESDQSIISQLNVIVNEGFPNLGGVDWDKVVQEEIVRQLEENGVTAITDNMRHSLAAVSEWAKIDLTDSDLELYPITVGNEGLEFDYAQSQFEADTSHLLNQALDHLEEVLGDFRIRATMRDIPEEILGIVLVGGSSNMPQVKKGIEDRFPQFAGKVAVRDPSFAVVKGAAHYCKMVGRKSS